MSKNLVLIVDDEEVRVSGEWVPTSPKARVMLVNMLKGRRLTTIDTLMEFNLMTPNARAAEMRRLGWPVRTAKVTHPKVAGEFMLAYYLDAHFIH